MVEYSRFAAFISYSSSDAAFARRLLRTLEHYSIPRSLGSFDLIGGGKPNRIYPICRDREEFGAGPLSERIEAALRASASLIVVCSPNSAASPWVQKEIESFVALGRQHRIFAIIADTAPILDDEGKDATRSCFPPAFGGGVPSGGAVLEPLAADARRGRDGFRNAWLKVVAGMIGVTPGQLIDRDALRRRRQRMIGGLCAAALSGVAALGVATLETRNTRSEFTSYSRRLVGEGLSLDAMAFALAGLPAEGDVIPVTDGAASQALSETGAYLPILGEFSSYNTLVSAARRYAIAITEDGAALHRLGSADAPIELGAVQTYGLSPDGIFFVFQRNDNNVFLRRLDDGSDALPLGSAGEYVSFKFSSDNRYLLLTDASGVLKLWRLSDLGVVRAFGRRSGSFSPDGRFLVVVDRQGGADLYDLDNLDAEPALLGQLSGELGFSSNSRFLTAADVNGVGLVFDLSNPEPPIRIAPGLRFTFSGDSRMLAEEDGPYATIAPIDGAANGVDLGYAAFLQLSPSGRYAAAVGPDGEAWLADTTTSSARRNLGRLDARTPPTFVFSPDGRYFAYRDAQAVGQLINLDGGQTTSLGAVSDRGLEFSRDGRFLGVLEQSYFFTLWNLERGSATTLGPITSFVFAPDGQSLVTSSYEEEREVVRNLQAWTTSRADICRTSGDQLRPFRPDARLGDQGTRELRGALRGRPWNPCDWRGLLAFDNGWEGLAQWLRLMRIRHFGAPDYTCAEVDAAGHTTELRRQACARPSSRPPQLHRPTAHN